MMDFVLKEEDLKEEERNAEEGFQSSNSNNCTDEGSHVLSIQSHTVHGYVGNKCAVFPLQVLGFEVDFVNSVQFSNHTGYPTVKGQVLGGDELMELLSGLEANSLLTYDYLLTGYIGSEAFLRAIIEVHTKLKAANPDLVYVCDPVLGDDGHYYVPEELVEIYKTDLLPLASIITPNHFEAGVLTGTSVTNQEEAVAACNLLHSMGPQIVVITSIPVEGDQLLALLSKSEGPVPQIYGLLTPKINGRFTGSGDLMAALLLANIHKHSLDLATALEKTASTMYHVIETTSKSAEQNASGMQELRLIQSKNIISEQSSCFKSFLIS